MIFFFFITYIYLSREEVNLIHVWSPRATFRNQLSSQHVGPRTWLNSVSLSSRHLYLLSHLARSKWCLSWHLSWETCGINYQDHRLSNWHPRFWCCCSSTSKAQASATDRPGFRSQPLYFPAMEFRVSPSPNQEFTERTISWVLGKEYPKHCSASSNFYLRTLMDWLW